MSIATDPVLSPREVAAQLGLHPKTVERYLRFGVLDGVKRRSRWYVRQSAVERYLSHDDRAA